MKAFSCFLLLLCFCTIAESLKEKKFSAKVNKVKLSRRRRLVEKFMPLKGSKLRFGPRDKDGYVVSNMRKNLPVRKPRPAPLHQQLMLKAKGEMRSRLQNFRARGVLSPQSSLIQPETIAQRGSKTL